MARLFYQHVRYATELPAFAVRQQLEQVVQPPPTGWRRWLGWRRPACQGLVEAATGSFYARVAHGRTTGPVVEGHWQAAPTVGSLVQLTVSLPPDTWLGLAFALLVLAILLFGVYAFRTPLSPAGFALPIPLLLLADIYWGMSRARRYFEDALQLTRLPA